MDFEVHSERQTYVEVLELEVRKIVRRVRAFPVPRIDEHHHDCGFSARDVAKGFAERLRRIQEIGVGHVTAGSSSQPVPQGCHLIDLENAFLGAREALMAVPASRWRKVISAPELLTTRGHMCRSELLWLALRELVSHDRHFGIHLRAAREHDAGGTRGDRDATSDPALAIVA